MRICFQPRNSQKLMDIYIYIYMESYGKQKRTNFAEFLPVFPRVCYERPVEVGGGLAV